MDDDNCAQPHELSTFMRAAARRPVDILTCQMQVFRDLGAPSFPHHVWLVTGGPVAAGVVRNCFGDANALVRKATFDRVGGFTELRGVGHEDWEFFARAALAGARIETIPEPLYWYRESASGMLRSGQLQANHRRSLRPYLESVPPPLRPALELLSGSMLQPFGFSTPWHDPELFRALQLVIDGLKRTPRLSKAARRSLRAFLRVADLVNVGQA
jgi:hypothetical protein